MVQRRLAARPEVREFLTDLAASPSGWCSLLTERPFLSGRRHPPASRSNLWARRPRSVRAAAWSAADAFLVDEALDVVGGTATFGHVVADEAQDLSAMQLRAIGRRCRFGSATLLGDLAQRTTPWSAARWGDAVGHLGRARSGWSSCPGRSGRPRRCSTSPTGCCPRSPLTSARPGRSGASPARCGSGPWPRRRPGGLAPGARRGPGRGRVGRAGGGRRGRRRRRGRLTGRGVEFREVDRFDTATRGPGGASAVKGLEFDQVVLVEPAEIADPALGPAGLRRLYTALTRAVLGLTIVHARPLPAALAPASVA